jgi:hypothetical protein
MSRIAAVVDAISSNPNKITRVINLDNYWFFLYNEKYAWCIQNRDNEGKIRYMLYFIKVAGDFVVNDPKQFEIVSRQDVDSLVKKGEAIEYDSNEVGSDEALHSFRMLYSAVKEKGIGLAKVFDEILGGQ